MSLCISNLSFSYSGKEVLRDIEINYIMPGQLTVLLGPNAAGKSTFFRCISGLLKPQSGNFNLYGKELSYKKPKEICQSICYMPQNTTSYAALTVFEAVLLARKNLSQWSVTEQDSSIVASCLIEVGIEDISHRYISELSGGQQQLVAICQILVRSASVFLLDEPTSALDLKRQLEVMKLIKETTIKNNLITIVALHDLSLSARFADNLLLLKEGEVVDFGSTENILNSKAIEKTFGVNIHLTRTKNNLISIMADL